MPRRWCMPEDYRRQNQDQERQPDRTTHQDGHQIPERERDRSRRDYVCYRVRRRLSQRPATRSLTRRDTQVRERCKGDSAHHGRRTRCSRLSYLGPYRGRRAEGVVEMAWCAKPLVHAGYAFSSVTGCSSVLMGACYSSGNLAMCRFHSKHLALRKRILALMTGSGAHQYAH